MDISPLFFEGVYISEFSACPIIFAVLRWPGVYARDIVESQPNCSSFGRYDRDVVERVTSPYHDLGVQPDRSFKELGLTPIGTRFRRNESGEDS